MSQIDTAFFKPFIDGALKTLEIQCQMKAKPKSPYIKVKDEQPDCAIAGVIGITSEKFNGSITLCFPEVVFLGMMERMLGEKFEKITDDLQDGVAEILNIIFGQAKVVLNSQGHTIQKAIPSVVRGEKLKTSSMSKSSVFVLPFATDLGEFQIEICSETKL